MAPPSALPPRAPGPPEIVYAGQLYPWKGVDVLLAAVARLPGQHLTIMGGRSPDARDDPDLASCRAIAARLGLGSRVAFGGFVPYGEVRSRLAGAGAAVLPLPDRLMSRYFTSPLKLFDYMAAGVPIVASDLPAVREVLTDGEDALLVPPGDPGVLAGALERLLTDHELGERLRQRAFAEVSRYTWDRRAERIIRAVMDVVATELPIVDGPAGARSARAFARVR
jgi:glycosyltransferase involved in cell wall biosynthesis